MKANLLNSQYKHIIFIFFALILSGLYACGSSDNGNSGQGSNNSMTIAVELASRFSVPPLTEAGTGSGTLTLDLDSGALSGTINFSALTGDVSFAHIHTGDAGTNSGVIITLIVDNTSDQLTVPAATVLDATQITAMTSGQYYVNVHTAAHGSGEIRGQIIPTGYELIRVELNGENQVPQVTTGNSGVGYLLVNTSTGEIRGNLTNTGLDDATQAHIHKAFAGDNSGTIVDLVNDGTNLDFWTFSATLSAADLSSLLTGELYFNVHTPAFNSGEVRGQILPAGVVMAIAPLTATEAQTAGTNASGTSAGTSTGYVTVNKNLSPATVKANLIFSGITPTAAHIHNPGIVHEFTLDLGAGTGVIDDTLTTTEVSQFESDNLYINLHTTAFAGGELRGQLTP